ncbi:hypothetical protein ACJ72_08680, partial [Emergomyces africanus]
VRLTTPTRRPESLAPGSAATGSAKTGESLIRRRSGAGAGAYADADAESETDEDEEGGGYYDPRRPTGCVEGCAGAGAGIVQPV